MSFSDLPARFGKYILLDRLAAGGMAEVFRAKVTGVEGFERLVAIKCMLPGMAADEHFTGMFVDEARLAAQVGHPNVVQIYELGREGERLYIAMELIAGRDLRHILKTAEAKGIRLPPQFAAYVVSKTAEGLDFAHRKIGTDGKPLGLVHRDVSPQNILVSYDGEVKVVDFGIAKASTEARGTQTQVGILKGKFAYMAPEQVTGHSLDRRADIFALGSVLYELLSGQRLFRGESDLTVLERVREAALPDFSVDLPPTAQRIVPVLQRALALSVEDRFEWAAEMAEALEPMLIEEQSIFGAKRASTLMRTLFAEEVAQLSDDLKRFAELTVPMDAAPIGGPAESTDVTKQPSHGRMVFESTFAYRGNEKKSDPAVPRSDTGEVQRPPPVGASAAKQIPSAYAGPRLTLRREPVEPVEPPGGRRAEMQRRPLSGSGGRYFAAEASPPGRSMRAPLSRPSLTLPPKPPPLPIGDARSSTLMFDRTSGVGRAMQRVKLFAAVAIGVTSALMGIVYYNNKQSMTLRPGELAAGQPVVDWLQAQALATRNNRWVDRYLFGGTHAEAPAREEDVYEELAKRQLAAPQSPVQSSAPAEPVAPVPKGYLRIGINGARRARVYVDGKDVGLAPLAPVPLRAGPHKVRVVQLDGPRRAREVHVRVGQTDTQDAPATVDLNF